MLNNRKWALVASGMLLAASSAAAQERTAGIGYSATPIPLHLHQPAPVSQAQIDNPPPGDWLSFRRSLNGWAYSPLNQINAANVRGLTLAWSRPLADGGYEGTPLVHDGVMYIIEPNDAVEAVDAGTGDLIWKFKRQYPKDFRGGGTKRNAAIWQDLLIDTSADGYAYALDIHTASRCGRPRSPTGRPRPRAPAAGRSSPTEK